MSATFDRLDHLAIHVGDLERSISWYQTSFSCELIFRSATRALLQFSNVKLELLLPSEEPPHIAFERGDAQTFGSLMFCPPDMQTTSVSDPTGNMVELVKI
jgi:catechol 2,3-dioxygenase-like lactoylglutathione lyase family enzyme